VAPLQKWWEKKLRGLGFRHYFLYTHEDVARFIEWELSGKGAV